MAGAAPWSHGQGPVVQRSCLRQTPGGQAGDGLRLACPGPPAGSAGRPSPHLLFLLPSLGPTTQDLRFNKENGIPLKKRKKKEKKKKKQPSCNRGDMWKINYRKWRSQKAAAFVCNRTPLPIPPPFCPLPVPSPRRQPPLAPPPALLLSVESRLVPGKRSFQVILEMKGRGNACEGAGIGKPKKKKGEKREKGVGI